MRQARESYTEDRLFLRWAIGYQTIYDYEEFKRMCQPLVLKDDEEIMTDVYSYLELFNQGTSTVEI